MPSAPHAQRLAVFVSGTGRTLKNLHACSGDGSLAGEIGLVLASGACPAEEWARAKGIATVVHPGDLSPREIDEIVARHGIDFVVLAGYLRLVPITPGLRNRVVNIHPALLPSFGGRGMFGARVHGAVLEAGCKVSGCTVHLCDDRYDTGPILAQMTCPVMDDDTPESLAARVFALELEAYPRALNELLTGRVLIDQRRTRLIAAPGGGAP